MQGIEMDGRFTILIVDDEPNNLTLLQLTLGETYDLKFSRDGAGALVAAEKHKPDLILLDIMMPEMDGYEVCRQLKANQTTKDIPVIFVTAMDRVEDESRGLGFGAVDYITKPVKPALVQARVATHLELKIVKDNIIIQNQKLKEQARHLFDFGAEKKAQVEKMALEVSKALQAITKERGDYIKSLADILQQATQGKNQQQLIASVKQNIEDGIRVMEKYPSKEVSLLGLQPGMITAHEIKDKEDRLFLASGSMITEGLIGSLTRHSPAKSIFVIG